MKVQILTDLLCLLYDLSPHVISKEMLFIAVIYLLIRKGLVVSLVLWIRC